MAKRLSKEQKEEIIQTFTEGTPIDEIAEKLECSKLTVIRNLKKFFGENKLKDLINNTQSKEKSRKVDKESESILFKENDHLNTSQINSHIKQSSLKTFKKDELPPITEFIEIPLLNQEIDNAPRKDLSSISISDMDFPKTVYMIVDKKIELEIKLLKDFPEWQFLPMEDLNRKTIKIYYDPKTAKSICNKDQKVIKVPNTNVFKLVTPFLISRGITRIISEDKLIAL